MLIVTRGVMKYSLESGLLWDVNCYNCWEVIFCKNWSVWDVNCNRRWDVIFCTVWSVVRY